MSREGSISCYFVDQGPTDKSLLIKTEKAFDGLITQVREIVSVVNDEVVKEIGIFILNNLQMRIIEQQKKPNTLFVCDYAPGKPLSKNYKPTLPVVFSIENVEMFKSLIEKSGTVAYYFRNDDSGGAEDVLGKFIAMRDPTKFTPLWYAINLFHEAKHAYDHINNPRYASLNYEQREVPAHLVELLIIRHYGGRALARIAEKYESRIRKKTGLPLEACSNEIIKGYVERYDDDLNRIFGKAKSKAEENLRMDRLLFGFVLPVRGFSRR